MLLRCFIIFHWILICCAFNPSFKAILNPDGSATHASITRCSLGTLTVEYLRTRFGISLNHPKIVNGICPSSLFTQIQNAFTLANYVGGSTYSRWENMIDEVVDHNELVDVLEQFTESRHFDSESFPGGFDIIRTRLQSAINALNRNDYETSNEHFGRLTHTLQDFYSHSNWIEMNNTYPHPDLGVNKIATSQFAAPTVQTCTNCATPDAVCRGNCDVSKGLTSGYFIFATDIFTKKPKGKCSHGGSNDATRNNDAIGGINKDALSSIHGYLHVSAAQTAYLATCKILREFRARVGDIPFGKFLNVLNRKSTTSRSSNLLDKISQKTPFVYTTTLNNLRKTDTFTILRQLVALPAVDSMYKAHVLSLARRKHVTIDIFRSANFRQSSFDFGQDLAQLTGGLYALYDDQEQVNMDMNPNERPELIDVFYSKNSSNSIRVDIDAACSDLFLEFFSQNKIPRIHIVLRKGNQTISLSSPIVDTTFYQSYRITNLSAGQWQLITSSSSPFTFDLHVSCSSGFRCFSRLFVDNDNPIHPGQVELRGNLIEGQRALLISTCDSKTIPIQNVQVTMVDTITNQLLAPAISSVFDAQSNRWMTNLTNIPSKLFRLRFSINGGAIQRLSRSSNQPSLVDVEVTDMKTTAKNTTRIKYRVLNYHSQSMKVRLLAKNLGKFMMIREYQIAASGSEEDEMEYDSKDRQSDITSDAMSLTVTSPAGDWNYDVVSF